MSGQSNKLYNIVPGDKTKNSPKVPQGGLNQFGSQGGPVGPNNSPHFDKTIMEASSREPSHGNPQSLDAIQTPLTSMQPLMNYYNGLPNGLIQQTQMISNALSQNQNSILMRDGRINQLDPYKRDQEGLYQNYVCYNNFGYPNMRAQLPNGQLAPSTITPNERQIKTVTTTPTVLHEAMERKNLGSSEEFGTSKRGEEHILPQEDKESEKKVCNKRKKVTRACIYCRRSHMTCNEVRPCSRCVIRNIGHLCHDQDSPGAPSATSGSGMVSPKERKNTTKSYSSMPLSFASEHMDNEYKVISNFVKDLEGSDNQFHPSNQAETFLMTAADPADGTYEERLHEIISAKYHAGLLKPYNYVSGYSRLQKYMDTNMSPTSRQRILNALSTFRPMFRQIAKTLTDIDLVLVEEGFERILLDYDRVFSSMGIPACLWRRTGEIFKGNKEFAALIGIPHDQLKEGKVCVYELMTEDSAVSYWDKYGNIAFDQQQKAMLSSCSLKNRRPNCDPHSIPCCFSFTIRRDKYNIPIAIVGNFLPIHPTSQ